MECWARVTSQAAPSRVVGTVGHALLLCSLCLNWCKWSLRCVMRTYSWRFTVKGFASPPVRFFNQKRSKSSWSWEKMFSKWLAIMIQSAFWHYLELFNFGNDQRLCNVWLMNQSIDGKNSGSVLTSTEIPRDRLLIFCRLLTFVI